jgi:predicted nucleic acid-binding protein
LGKFLAQFDVVKLDAAISDSALQLIRRYTLSHGLEVPDALIAATAMVMDVPFASRNQRDYRFIGGLKLQSYS